MAPIVEHRLGFMRVPPTPAGDRAASDVRSSIPRDSDCTASREWTIANEVTESRHRLDDLAPRPGPIEMHWALVAVNRLFVVARTVIVRLSRDRRRVLPFVPLELV